MDIIYCDNDIVLCIKPAGVLSTDEPGGLPQLLRKELGGDIRTVHRLDRVVSGLILLARNADAASALSQQMRGSDFKKEYLAVVHGLTPATGSMRDLLYRDKARKMTFVAGGPGKGVQEALLDYETLGQINGNSLVRIHLLTGRTHQIRCQFASRGFPLLGERKYYTGNDDCQIALWSHTLSFLHPVSGERLVFTEKPPLQTPWDDFNNNKNL